MYKYDYYYSDYIIILSPVEMFWLWSLLLCSLIGTILFLDSVVFLVCEIRWKLIIIYLFAIYWFWDMSLPLFDDVNYITTSFFFRVCVFHGLCSSLKRVAWNVI